MVEYVATVHRTKRISECEKAKDAGEMDGWWTDDQSRKSGADQDQRARPPFLRLLKEAMQRDDPTLSSLEVRPNEQAVQAERLDGGHHEHLNVRVTLERAPPLLAIVRVESVLELSHLRSVLRTKS